MYLLFFALKCGFFCTRTLQTAATAREQNMKKLEAVATKGGVKGIAAQKELHSIRDEDDRAKILAKQRTAQKAVDEDGKKRTMFSLKVL